MKQTTMRKKPVSQYLLKRNKCRMNTRTTLLATLLLSTTTPLLAGTPVNIDNFVRAETDFYLNKRADAGYFGQLMHLRNPVDIDNQPVIRANRDTLYSYGVFDLATPVTITLPEQSERFQSVRVINQDHYIVLDSAKPGVYEFSQEKAGTRYIHVNVRTLVNPDDPEDVKSSNALQDQVKVSQESAGALELPDWDLESQAKLRKAILRMGPFVPDSNRMFGAKEETSEVRHLIGTAGGWGGGAPQAVLFLNNSPEKNDGNTPYVLKVKDVPVDGFWSISIYNEQGFFEKNPDNAYSLNNLTATPDEDGGFTIHLGGDPSKKNFLYTPKGWNYTVRMYLPREEVLNSDWKFPQAEVEAAR